MPVAAAAATAIASHGRVGERASSAVNVTGTTMFAIAQEYWKSAR